MRSALLSALALLLLVTVSLVAPPAAAHGVYVSSNPTKYDFLATAPVTVTVTLSEAVQPGTQTIRVTNAAGARFDVGGAKVSATDSRTLTVDLAPLGPGVYTVTWIVEDAVDGHWTSDAFYFMVLDNGRLSGSFPGQSPPAAPVSLSEVLLRFVAFLSLAISLGGTLFAMMAWMPAGRGLEEVGEAKYEMGFRGLLLWSRLGAFLFAAAVGGWWVNAVTEAPPDVVPSIIGSSFSISLVVRALLGLAIAGALSVALARAGRAPPPDDPSDPFRASAGSEDARIPLLVAGSLGILAVLAGSSGSHAAATSVSLAGVGLDALHEIGVYVWLGGLLALFRLRARLREASALPFAGQLYGRFSTLAGYAVALVLGAGVVLGILLVGTLDALVGTTYGLTLLAKVSLFVPMVAVGAYNRYRLLPRISSNEGASSFIAALTRNVHIEVTIGAVVLVLAAILTASVPPPTVPVTGAFDQESTVNGIRVEFLVTPFPATPGAYTFQILLWNATTGLGFGGSTRANLTFAHENSTVTLPMDGPHGNHYFVDSAVMSSTGMWRVDVAIVPTAGPPLRTTFYVFLTSGG